MSDWIDEAAAAHCKLLEALLVAPLAVLVVMVFGNGALRYGFKSRITVSEELSRRAFVCLTLLGAFIAIRENGHLGTDMLIGRRGPSSKKVRLAIAESAMIYCAWHVFSGSLA